MSSDKLAKKGPTALSDSAIRMLAGNQFWERPDLNGIQFKDVIDEATGNPIPIPKELLAEAIYGTGEVDKADIWWFIDLAVKGSELYGDEWLYDQIQKLPQVIEEPDSAKRDAKIKYYLKIPSIGRAFPKGKGTRHDSLGQQHHALALGLAKYDRQQREAGKKSNVAMDALNYAAKMQLSTSKFAKYVDDLKLELGITTAPATGDGKKEWEPLSFPVIVEPYNEASESHEEFARRTVESATKKALEEVNYYFDDEARKARDLRESKLKILKPIEDTAKQEELLSQGPDDLDEFEKFAIPHIETHLRVTGIKDAASKIEDETKRDELIAKAHAENLTVDQVKLEAKTINDNAKSGEKRNKAIKEHAEKNITDETVRAEMIKAAIEGTGTLDDFHNLVKNYKAKIANETKLDEAGKKIKDASIRDEEVKKAKAEALPVADFRKQISDLNKTFQEADAAKGARTKTIEKLIKELPEEEKAELLTKYDEDQSLSLDDLSRHVTERLVEILSQKEADSIRQKVLGQQQKVLNPPEQKTATKAAAPSLKGGKKGGAKKGGGLKSAGKKGGTAKKSK